MITRSTSFANCKHFANELTCLDNIVSRESGFVLGPFCLFEILELLLSQ